MKFLPVLGVLLLPFSGAAAETSVKPTPSRPAACLGLSDVWSEGFHKISGSKYWFSRVFSLDGNNDGAVDNVGFLLKSDSKPDLLIYYFPEKGGRTVQSVPTLRLEDDRTVLMTCYGQADFKKPVIKKKESPSGIKVDLGKELAAKTAEKAYSTLPKPVVKKSFQEGAGLVFVIFMGAGVLLVVGGAAGYVIARRRASRRRKERRQGGERRKRQESFDGPEKRQDKDRREVTDRRSEDDDRRD